MWFRYCPFLPTSPAPCYPICQCLCLLLFLPPSVLLVFTTSPPAPSPSPSPAPKRPPSAYVTYPPRMRPASGPRTARAFIPATATYRLGRQQRTAPHDRHQGPSQHDGTTAVGVVGGGTIAGAGGGFGKCGGRRGCTTGRRREHAATGFEESTENRGDKKRRILDTCDTVFHLEKGGKIKKKGTARYPTQAAREEPAPSPPAPPPVEKDRVTRRIRYTQNSICRRRPLANPP